MVRLIRLCDRAFLPVVAIAALGSYVWIYSHHLNDPPIRADGYSYYLYLPAWFIYHDPSLEKLAVACCNGAFPGFSAVTRWFGTGGWVDPHPIGTAILIAPFFLVAHLLTMWSNLAPDGFSFYYQHAAGLAGVFYLVAGLALLKRFLSGLFPAGITLAALVSVTFGTNLFHYGTYDSVYSHVYSFFLFSGFMVHTASWYGRPTVRRSVTIGLLAGLIFLTRHANALFLVFFPLYGIIGPRSLGARLRLLAGHGPKLAGAALTAAVIAVPQLLIYEHATGSFLPDPYENLMRLAGTQAFHFRDPKVMAVLFSVTKGLFFWSPLLALSVAGFFVLRGGARAILIPSVIYLAINLYLVASWWDWQLGGSYGHRGFTDGLGVLSVPMAASYAWAVSRPRLRAAVAASAALAIALSIVQMIQYWIGIWPFQDVTWTTYSANFLRFHR